RRSRVERDGVRHRADRERRLGRTVVAVPEPEGLVRAGRSEQLAVMAETELVDGDAMAGLEAFASTGLRVPPVDPAFEAGRDHVLSVGAEGDRQPVLVHDAAVDQAL